MYYKTSGRFKFFYIAMLTCEHLIFVQMSSFNLQKLNFSNSRIFIKVNGILTQKLVLKCFPYEMTFVRILSEKYHVKQRDKGTAAPVFLCQHRKWFQLELT